MAPPSRGRERVGIRSRRGDRSGQGQRPVEKALRGCRMHEQDGYQRKKRRHNPAHHVDDHQRHRRPFDVVDTIGRVLWAASCVPSLRGLVCMAPHTARTTAWRRRRRVQGSTARQSPATHRPPVRMRPAIRLHAAQWHMRRSLSERLRHDAARPDCSARSRARTPSLLHPAAGANHCPLVLTDGREPRPVWVAAAPLRPVPFVYLCFAKGRYKETHTRGRALHRAPPPSA